MKNHSLFNAAYRAIACTPNLSTDVHARSRVEQASAQIRELEKNLGDDPPTSEVVKKVTDLVDSILDAKEISQDERYHYRAQLRSSVDDGSAHV